MLPEMLLMQPETVQSLPISSQQLYKDAQVIFEILFLGVFVHFCAIRCQIVMAVSGQDSPTVCQPIISTLKIHIKWINTIIRKSYISEFSEKKSDF